MRDEITVVGGGLAGLVAAVHAAERGHPVTLHEAHASLGGRARATSGPHVAHDGAHVFYADGPHWRWLRDHGLVRGLGLPAPRQVDIGFRDDGRLRRIPTGRFTTMMFLHRARRAPVDQDFLSWAEPLFGHRTAMRAANAIGVATYDADTANLSAAFVWNLLTRVFTPKPPAVRWVVGGWQAVVDRLAELARARGVRIETSSRRTELPATPTIVATELPAARALLGDDALRWRSGNTALLDLAVPRGRQDRFVAFDLDAGGFHESYSAQDPTVAPRGESLFQLTMPVRSDERRSDALSRLERFADLTVPEWRQRATWQRSGHAFGRTGALDPPGSTWRDRPAIDRGDDVFLAGDMVAAPGMRGEIAINSGLLAAERAVQAIGTAATRGKRSNPPARSR